MRRPYVRLKSGVANPVICGRKFCPQCGRWRQVCDFGIKSDGKVRCWCRTCQRLSNRRSQGSRTPEQRAKRREYERIWREVHRRRDGVPERPLQRTLPVERILLPVAPIVSEMKRYIACHDDLGWRGLALAAGCQERDLYRLRFGESAHVRIDLADRIAVAVGVPLALIYPPDD